MINDGFIVDAFPCAEMVTHASYTVGAPMYSGLGAGCCLHL